MTEQHPITPPPELLQQWATEYWGNPGELIGEGEKYIAIQAARWGADQELDACCGLIGSAYVRDQVRAARRPQPPSLKEQALSDFDGLMSELDGAGNYSNCAERIRRALEALDD